jgi:tripartite ATP-independent transporter DctP family solute receptor
MSRTQGHSLVRFVFATAVLLAAACGTAAAQTVLKLGHVAASDPKDNWQAGSLKFAELVEQKSKGTVKVQVFPSSQLGNDRDMAEGMRLGSVDFSLNAGVLSNFEPRMGVLEIPYIFRDADHMRKVLNGPVGAELAAALQKSGIRVIGWWERGPRQLTVSKPVKSVKDLKGMKIRVPEIPVSVDAWRAFGANPTPMAFGEVYTGLQQRVIDGQENPLAIISSAKLNEVQKFVVLTNHIYGYVALAMSERSFQKLSPEQRTAVLEAAKEATAFENKLVWDNEKLLAQDLQAKGMQFVEVDLAEFAAAAKPVHATYAQKLGKDLYDRIVNTK